VPLNIAPPCRPGHTCFQFSSSGTRSFSSVVAGVSKTEASSGELLNSIDVKGAINSGLISYAIDGEQYVAVAVGGATENPSRVAGALKVSLYSLHGN
jgi:hypothetical protein